MPGTQATSATGGSASSQADSLEGRVWNPHPLIGSAIKLVMLLVPLAVGVAAVKVAIDLVPRPVERLAFWIWMIALIIVSFVASIGTQRLMRRLAPLPMLFKMSLVFPDEAPSRFKAAMRSGSSRSLSRGAKSSGPTSTPEQAAAEALLALIARLSQHDRLTRGHVERVRAYSVMLGEEIGLSRADLEKLNWAALIHDIGKLDVPESLLNKPGRPTAQEWLVLRTHPLAGNRYVAPLRGWLGEWVDATTQHHERFDGQGYPRRLAGKDISLAGRIVSIADAYDVMTAARSYKKPLPAAQARAELTRNSGTQFDPQLVRSFLEISLGKLRRAIGPVGWLAHLPDLIRTPLTAVATSTTGLVAVGAIGLAGVAGAAAPLNMPPPRHQSAPYAEEVAEHVSPTTVLFVGGLGESGQTTPATTTTVLGAPDQPAAASGPATANTVPTTDAPAVAADVTETTPVEIIAAITTLPPESPEPPPTIAPATTATPITVAATTGQTIAVDDQVGVKDDKNIAVHVLQNDTFGGSTVDLTTLSIVIGPAHGTATVAGENITYRSGHEYSGTDAFTYSICSLSASCAQATVTVTVTH